MSAREGQAERPKMGLRRERAGGRKRPIADSDGSCQRLFMRLILPLAASLLFSACGDPSACYGMSDKDVLASIQRAYANARLKPEAAANFRLDKRRVIAVERDGAKGEDAFAGMLFRQDDGRLLSIRLFEDCTYQTSPETKPSELKTWAYPLRAPRLE